ncbi:hypothetical protein MIDIC_340012 [Alphaproteobacteria bacterium]
MAWAQLRYVVHFKKWGLFLKKSTLYKEADSKKKAEFLEKISSIPPDNLVYINESGMHKYIYKERGYAKKGQKIYDFISGSRYSKENFVTGKVGEQNYSSDVLSG